MADLFRRSALVLGLALASACLPHGLPPASSELFEATEASARSVSPERSAPVDDEALGETLELGPLVAEVLAQDPELGAKAHEVRSIVEDARAEGALPEPGLYVEIWNAPLTRPYALRQADMIMVGVQQTLPAPGVRSARAEARLADARVALAELHARERELTEQVTTLFVDYVAATLADRARAAQQSVLDAMHDAAVARVASGGSIGDVARVDVERVSLARARRLTASELARIRVELNVLLARDPDAPMGSPSIEITSPEDLATEELGPRAARTSSAVVVARARTEASGARARVARYEARRPSFMFSVAWYQAPTMRAGVGGMVTMSLPWLSRGPSARERAAREDAARDESLALAEERRALAEARVVSVRIESLEASLESIRATREATLRALESLPLEYVAGRIDLLAWMDASRQLLDADLEAASTMAELGRAVAELERALGIAPGDAVTEEAP